MPFLSELVVKDAGDNDWKVVQPLRYQADTQCFEVPAGAETDFASVPVLFQWLIPRSGRYTKAAVLHDHLWRTPIDGVSRGDADGIFRRCMAELGVPFLRRWVMWAGVRLGSLWKSRFHDRLSDVPKVLLVVLFPGLFVIAAGVIVLLFLLAFFVFEWGARLVLAVARIHPSFTKRTKPVNNPRIGWYS
ncbi:MAG: DUF1353 domain-containing protein [Actinomycetota bacterium]|nr:DUF1353 domain-containing protein [Actinomycetota bacterium]